MALVAFVFKPWLGLLFFAAYAVYFWREIGSVGGKAETAWSWRCRRPRPSVARDDSAAVQAVQLRSRRGKNTSRSRSRTVAATGMAISAPTMPRAAPPSRTATNVAVAGTSTLRPITRGTMK